MRKFEIKGIVTWIDLSGGFFGIIAEDGTEYYPVNGLPTKAQIAGLSIGAEIQKSHGMNIHMWGIPVKIDKVKLLPN